MSTLITKIKGTLFFNSVPISELLKLNFSTNQKVKLFAKIEMLKHKRWNCNKTKKRLSVSFTKFCIVFRQIFVLICQNLKRIITKFGTVWIGGKI
jgi:hypothetical protein